MFVAKAEIYTLKRNNMTTTILQIRDEVKKKAINIKIGVDDIERFKAFIGKQDLKYTYEEIDMDV